MAAVRVSSLLARGINFYTHSVIKVTPISVRLFPGTRNVLRISPGLYQASIRSYSASNHLEDCLKKELKMERSTMDEVPIVSGFEVSYTGSQAILTRQYNNEIVKVEIDANHAVEVANDEDEDGPFFVPAFTVTVTKPSLDSSIQLECSFDEEGSYNEQGNEWDNLRIDSICVLQAETTDSTSYTADTQFLSDELLESLKEYLRQRGINQKFSSEIIGFYQSFEHHNYVNNFLGNLQKFLAK